jgi:hypothetical protein
LCLNSYVSLSYIWFYSLRYGGSITSHILVKTSNPKPIGNWWKGQKMLYWDARLRIPDKWFYIS